MEVSTPASRRWTTVSLGAYLFTTPWIFGASGAEANSVNAWIVGACIAVAPLRVSVVSAGAAHGEPPLHEALSSHQSLKLQNLLTCASRPADRRRRPAARIV